jgi:GDPmannose 4,6-dehydratase
MKTAMVIGVSGMDGQTMTEFLLSKQYNVIGTYRRNTKIIPDDIKQHIFYNNPKLELKCVDINDQTSIRKLFEEALKKYNTIDEVYLLAAQSHVGKSFEIPEQTVITNGMSVYYFLNNIKELTPKTKLYFAATSELFGGNPINCPFNENSKFECRSPYSIGKDLGVKWIEYYKQTHGIFATYGILFNHSSHLRNIDFFIRKVTNSAARIACGQQTTLKLGNINFYRDEHWSDFGVEAMWKMLQLEAPETFVICRGRCFHGEEFLYEAFSHFNLKWQDYVVLDKSLLRPNEVVKLIGNPQKAIDKLGWKPERMPFKDHIKLMCEYDYSLVTNTVLPL